MNPVIGVDISKSESDAQAFVDRGIPYVKTFYFQHTREGLESFLQFALELESHSGQRPAVILEATGHYQSPVVQFLEEHQFLFIVRNQSVDLLPSEKNQSTQGENGYC